MHLEESNQFYQKLENHIAKASEKIRVEERRLQQLQRLQREQQKRKKAGKVVKTVRWTTVPTTKPSSYTDSNPISSLFWLWRFLLLVALEQLLVIMAPQYESIYPIMENSPQAFHRLVMDNVDVMRQEAKDMNQNQGQTKERLNRFAPLMGPFGNKIQQ
jgi:hypothetical protein